MYFIAYTFKEQVHVFAGRVKIVSHSSCRTSAILKYFCPLKGITMLTWNVALIKTNWASLEHRSTIKKCLPPPPPKKKAKNATITILSQIFMLVTLPNYRIVLDISYAFSAGRQFT